MSSRFPARNKISRVLLAISLLAAVLLLSAEAFFGATPANAFTQPNATVFINEIHYDNTGTDADEAIEIAGPAGTDLAGWRLVLYNGNGGTSYNTRTLAGTIPNQSGGRGAILFTYPANGIQNGGTGTTTEPDGIALVDASNTLIQFLSYEGSFTGAGAQTTANPAGTVTSTNIGVAEAGTETAGQSLQLTGTGCEYEDFTWTGPTARTHTPPSTGAVNTGQTFSCGGDTAPTVTSTTPADNATNVAVDANIVINFSENVTVTGNWVQIACATSGTRQVADIAVTGGPQTYTLNPNTDFSAGETCTVTIEADNVQDQDGTAQNLAADFQFDFTVVDPGCGGAFTPIYTIQGSGTASPSANQTGVTTEGIVTADTQGSTGLNGFFVQDATGDGNTATSDGIFVFVPAANALSSVDVAVGDRVRLTGRVVEFNTLTEIDNLTALVVCSAATPLSPTVVTLPETTNGELEQYEGMLIAIQETLTVGQNFFLGRFGQVTLSSEGRLFQPTNTFRPNTQEAIDQANENARRLLVLDDARSSQNPNPIPYIGADNTLRAGDTTAAITGTLDFGPINSNSNIRDYRVQPTITPTFARTNPRTAAPEAVGGSIQVASFNVLNYFNGDGMGGGFPTARGADTLTEFNRQRAKTIAAILGLDADILGLIEMENDGTGSTSALQDLVNGLNDATAPGTYTLVTEPFPGSDAIKVSFIYRPASVSPVGAAVNDTDPIHNRPPLAQTFEANGQRFTVIVNHFKSKSCDGATGAQVDQGDGQGCFNNQRVQQSNALLDFIEARQAATGDDDVLIIGDLNAYGEEDPIFTLEQGGLVNQLELFVGEPYSFIFDGQSGYLDHALTTSSLSSQINDITEWHINADEPSVIDYNTEFKPQDFYAPNAFRSSDHDPVLVGLNLTRANLAPSTKTAVGIAETVRVGEVLTYTVAISNTGGLAGGLTLSDPIPAGTEYVAGSVTTESGPPNATYDAADDAIEIAAADMGAGDLLTVTFQVTVMEQAQSTGTITNTAVLSATSLTEPLTLTVPTEVFTNTTGADGFYNFNDSTEADGPAPNFQDISGTGTLLLGAGGDDAEAGVTMPFTIRYYNLAPTNQLCVGNNGGIVVGTLTCDVPAANTDMSAAPANFVAPFWDDLDDETGGVYTAVLGSAPNRTFVVQWDERPHTDGVGSATFQVLFFEGSNDIEFQYADVVFGDPAFDYGASATVGIKGSTIQYSFNQSALRNGLAIGFAFAPTAVQLSGFTAELADDAVLLRWETISEIENAGFNLLRATSPDAPSQAINDGLIPSQGPNSSDGFSYQWVDSDVEAGNTYYYWLETVSFSGETARYGPVSVEVNVPTALTVAALDAQPLPSYHALMAALGLLALAGTAMVWRRKR